MLASVKEREKAEEQAWLEENQEAGNENAADGTETKDGEQTEQQTLEEAPVFVDDRTPEEKEEERFQWANVGIARLLAERKRDTGVIIFYADDLRYDIAQLKAFYSSGKKFTCRTRSDKSVTAPCRVRWLSAQP